MKTNSLEKFKAKHNLLPRDGTVHYYGKIYTAGQSDALFTVLLNEISWQHDEVKLFGKRIITKREVAWYAEAGTSYRYSGITKQAQPWTPTLSKIRQAIEALTGERFNACLLNLYHSGAEGMAWHSDDEKELRPNGIIASLSFGAERKFSFKHKQTHEREDILLEHGSLLVMKDTTQTHWQHRLPPTKKINQPRINLTFRQMGN